MGTISEVPQFSFNGVKRYTKPLRIDNNNFY